MPKQSRTRTGKRKRPPEEIPSSLSLEVVSSVRRGDRATKKRVVEKLDFEPPSPIPLPDDCDIPTSGSQADPSNPMDLTQLVSDATSRSVSSIVQEWLPYRPEYYYEILRTESPLRRDPTRPTCKPAEHECLCDSAAEYRCLCCSSRELVCKGCLLSRHAGTPLHRIQKWNGRHYDDSTLTSAGLVFQLGHIIGDACPHPTSLQNLMVFDLSGAHRLVVQYCDCDRPPPKRVQLLRSSWFPATIERPSTAFAFDILDFFHKLQDRNKCNPYDFYHAIIQRTDAAGLKPEIHRYNEITLVLRLWIHLQLLKRGGAVLHFHSSALPAEGSMAVACPACPRPGTNTIVFPDAESWKNTLILSMDGCFKLKGKDRGFDDPDLSAGLTYTVKNEPYQKHLSATANAPDPISTCGPELNAVNQALTKFSNGYAVTGVIAVSCRHGFVLPKGVVDLQKGERHVNADYAFMSAVADAIAAGITDIVVTYDIACQWGINLAQRLLTYSVGPSIRLDSLNSFRVAVPDLHVLGHAPLCQTSFSLAYMDGVGKTHGEGVETIWAHNSSIAVYTRENGPNARHLILDDHWNGWNWRKYIGLRTQLLTMLERASEWAKILREAADLMTKAWPKAVPRWRKMLLAYKRARSNPNPFEEPDSDTALIELKKRLAKEDLQQQGAGVSFPHGLSPSTFLQCALEVETTQRNLEVWSRDNNNGGSSDSFAVRRRALITSINDLHAPQRLYMPGAESLLDNIDPLLLADRPQDVELWLPSALPSATRDGQCVGGLPRIEYRLRFAQAANALHNIRLFRRLTRVITLKSLVHITNTQGTTTRGRGVFERTKANLSQAVSSYRVSREAIMKLAPNEEFGIWKTVLLVLKNEDIRGPGDEGAKSKSRFVQSWIWMTASRISTSTEDPDLDAALRVEWCKAQERARRYEEEVELVLEEMRRTLVTFEYNACEWEQRATRPLPATLDPTTVAGAAAYAHKQAKIHRQLIPTFINDWYEILEGQPLAAPWLQDYDRPPKSQRRRLECNVKLFHSSSPALRVDARDVDDAPSGCDHDT